MRRVTTAIRRGELFLLRKTRQRSSRFALEKEGEQMG
jgi:hypothetical protein